MAVYPRLDELLRTNDLSVAELERRIEQRFGLSVDPKTLYRLASAEPVRRADLEIVGAVAALLGVGLGDLFDVHAVPVEEHDESEAIDLSVAESQRLSALFDRQAQGKLSKGERQELETLVSEYGRRLHERRLVEIAAQRGISVEEARREVGHEFEQAQSWWHDFEANPARRAAIATQARRRRRQTSE